MTKTDGWQSPSVDAGNSGIVEHWFNLHGNPWAKLNHATVAGDDFESREQEKWAVVAFASLRRWMDENPF
ncbi:MAG: hypothetical protein HY763_09310 [Planctomycetes bacterium]|nr:hypothetical protein [Planctomycetota bacterium]